MATQQEKKPLKNALSNIGKALVKFGLPAIGTAIGGPAGTVVAGTIGGILGVDPDRDDVPDAIEAALATASPEVLVQLRQIEANVALSLQETERAALANDAAEIDALTERLRLDTGSQSRLSQNIRPVVTMILIAIYALYITVTTIAVLLSYHGSGRVDPAVTEFLIDVTKMSAGLVATSVTFYFGGRVAENYKHGKPRDRALEILLGRKGH